MRNIVLWKQIREIVGSTAFAVTFGVCSLLILLAFYTGAAGYAVDVERHEAAKRENLKQLEGVTDWLSVRNHRIFLPPQPLASLVAGVANDIGRTTPVRGQGDAEQVDSRYGDEPIFAVFRFLDLEFIFRIVLSLFAILFAYDAVSGEKERGTLALSFANPVRRHEYIIGKLLGSFVALAVPLLIPILLGVLLLPLLGVPLGADEWARLALIVLTGLLYLAVFLTLSVAVSTMTARSSHSFLILLVVWVMSVAVIPGTAVLVAGRAVDVLSVDEIGARKAEYNRQLFAEERKRMAGFSSSADPRTAMSQFQKFMGEIAEERKKEMAEFSARLDEERANRQAVQEGVALGLARVSPSATFSLAAGSLAGTSLALKDHYRQAARAYQETYAKFVMGKTGVNLGGGMVFRMIEEDGQQPKPVDAADLPPFIYEPRRLRDVLPAALADMGLLALTAMALFAASVAAFNRYDLR
jgi:hypothetical protein